MKYFSRTSKELYFTDEKAFIPPLRNLTELERQWYLWKFFHEPGYHPNKQRCNTLMHGASTPRGK